jgi:precorrin-3B C17-methyltransferase
MKKGKIILVGFGPGSAEHMTFRAREAIEESDVVIGYSTYIKLVKDLLVGKKVIRKGMTEETDRAVEAYEHAKQGLTVALISSGDIGVYGMAGPSYEVLFQAGWKPGDDIEVEVVPGSTALSSCAALVGSPLTHDFCSISLSDLLTPWPTIACRLNAVAAADFVIALYNPKSGRRRQQIVEAQRIFLKYRSPDTPVAIVKSAYRKAQRIELTTLEAMAEYEIGMLTTVLIGNSSTFIKEGLMVTPRGYANKYEDITGSVKEGEQRGRSLSLGLDGWTASIKQAVEAGEDIEKLASNFDLSVEEIFLASSIENVYSDVSEGLERLKLVIAEFGFMKSGQIQMPINPQDIEISSSQISLKKDLITAQIDVDTISSIWFIDQSVCLLNIDGRAMMSFHK